MSFTVDIDQQRCQGHGKCVLHCPEVFDTDEQGFVELRGSTFDDALRVPAQRAVEDCPETALRLVDSH